jgi:hypothetical protein
MWRFLYQVQFILGDEKSENEISTFAEKVFQKEKLHIDASFGATHGISSEDSGAWTE